MIKLSFEEFAEIYLFGYPSAQDKFAGIVIHRYSLYETNPIGLLPMREEILNMIIAEEKIKTMKAAIDSLQIQ